jgi:RNA polymerase sigma factor (sigma-70 family)
MGNAQAAKDGDLLVAAASDLAAFEEFYRRYVRRVTAFAASRCSSAQDVADVVAQTFVRLLDAAGRYDVSRGEPEPFVLGIAANTARQLEHRRIRQLALTAKLSGRSLLTADDTERIDAAIDAAREARRLEDALAGVPEAEREVLQLVADGHTPSQAAEELGITPGTARTRLSRGRARLRTRLQALPQRSNP